MSFNFPIILGMIPPTIVVSDCINWFIKIPIIKEVLRMSNILVSEVANFKRKGTDEKKDL